MCVFWLLITKQQVFPPNQAGCAAYICFEVSIESSVLKTAHIYPSQNISPLPHVASLSVIL